MRSLQWRMLAALGLVIALAWAMSITMFVSYLTAGQSNMWRSGLHSLGVTLVKALPDNWVRKHEPQEAAGGEETPVEQPPSSAGQMPDARMPPSQRAINEPGSILTAMLLNTIELAIVGILMWWAVVASLRPFRAMSDDIARRKAFDSEPLALDKVPSELRPLIVAFNSLLARVDTAMRAEGRAW